MAGKRDIVVGLDIGTTKVCAIVAQKKADETMKVIGIGVSPSNGLKKGVVVNIENTIDSIVKAIEEAENMASVEITSVYAGIAGNHIKCISNRGMIPISSEDKEITEEDIAMALNSAEAIKIPPDREVIHCIPQDFTIDGVDGIKDPKGMHGVRMEAKVNIITGAVTAAQNLCKCIEKAELDINDLVLEPLASSLAVLTEEEKDSGVVLVDIGGGTTDIMIFSEGIIRYTDVLGVGGDNVTQDISVGLKLPMVKAEETKKKFGCALASLVDRHDEFTVPGIIGRKSDSMRRQYLSEIIQFRMEEIFMMVKNQIQKSGHSGSIGAGIVLTGGASLIQGCSDLAQNIFNVPVRIGRPRDVSGIVEVMDSPIYATGVGLAKYGFEYKDKYEDSELKGSNAVSRLFYRIKRWYSEYF